MKSRILILVIISLIVIDGIQLWNTVRIKNKYRELAFLSNSKEEVLTVSKDRLQRVSADLISSQRIKSTRFELNLIGEAKNAEAHLVLRVHINNCNDCVNQTLRRMEMLSKMKDVNPIVLANFPTAQAFKAIYPTSLPVKIVGHISQDSISASKPYLMLVNRSGKIEDSLLPEWDMLDILDSFFDLLANTSKHS